MNGFNKWMEIRNDELSFGGRSSVRCMVSSPVGLISLPTWFCIYKLFIFCCRDRWKAFERHCAEMTSRGDVTGRCPTGSSPRMCREAMVRLAGTELTTNCTCAVSDPGQYRLCIDLQRRIQQSNACKGKREIMYWSTIRTWRVTTVLVSSIRSKEFTVTVVLVSFIGSQYYVSLVSYGLCKHVTAELPLKVFEYRLKKHSFFRHLFINPAIYVQLLLSWWALLPHLMYEL